MTTSELISYIKKQIENNISNDVIISKLTQAGWHREDIDEGFSVVLAEVKKEVPIIKTPKIESNNNTKPVSNPIEAKDNSMDKYREPISGDSVVDIDLDEHKTELPKAEEPKIEAPKVEVPIVELPKVEPVKEPTHIIEAPKVEQPQAESPKIWTPMSVPIKEKAQIQDIKPQTTQIEIQNVELPASSLEKQEPQKIVDGVKPTSSIVDLQNPEKDSGFIPNLKPKMVINPLGSLPKDDIVELDKKAEAPKSSLPSSLPKIAMLSSYQNDILSFKNKAKENIISNSSKKNYKLLIVIISIVVFLALAVFIFTKGYIDIGKLNFSFIKKDPKTLLLNNSKVLSSLKSYKTETDIEISSPSFSNISYGLISGEAVTSPDKDSFSISTLGVMNKDEKGVLSDNFVTIKGSLLSSYITTDIKNNGSDLFVSVPDLSQIIKENAPEPSIVKINEQQFELIPPLFSSNMGKILSNINVYKMLSSGMSSYIDASTLGTYNELINNVEITEKGQENIKGVDTYHYSINTDRQLVKNLLIKISENFTHNLSAEDSIRLNEILGSTKVNSFDIWIGKGDNNIYQYSAVLDIPLSKIIGFEDKSIGDNTVSITWKTTYYDFNISNNIFIPETSISVIDFVKNIKETQMKNEVYSFKQLATNLHNIEKSYGVKSNTNGSCMNPSSGSLFSPVGHPKKANTQVSEISLFLNKTLGITNGVGSCYSTSKDWSFSIPISDNYDPAFIPEGGYKSFFCIDSTGFSQNLTALPSGVVCK